MDTVLLLYSQVCLLQCTQSRRCEAQLLMIRPHMMWEVQLKVASPADLSMQAPASTKPNREYITLYLVDEKHYQMCKYIFQIVTKPLRVTLDGIRTPITLPD